MRLAIFADQLLYKIPGGIGSYLRGLIPALLELDGDLDYLLLHCGPAGKSLDLEGRPLEERRLPGGRALNGVLWHYLGFPPLERLVGSIDLLHAPGLVIPSCRAPLVVTVHDLAVMKYPQYFPPRWRRFLGKGLELALRRARLMLAVSQCTASDLSAILKDDDRRVRVIPNGVSPPHPLTGRQIEEIINRLRLPRRYLLFVGTLEPRKNLDRLLDAYQLFRDRNGEDMGLVLAGALGWGEGEILSRAARMKGVTVTGLVSAPELEALFYRATALVYPSLYEGFGLPVLEAMARRVPVVTSDLSSLKEVAGDAALLVDPYDILGLAEAMEKIVSDERLRRDLAERGEKRAGEFTWGKAAAATREAYLEAVS